MLEPSSRRLAAILFADIAGYTALMQHDEQAALEKLARFKQMLEAKTAAFQGNIIQYYGDGCLVVFDSPLDAVGCAKALQQVFRKAPDLPDGEVGVPVRIGIHLGDVVFKEGNAFGDAVNIASRVESMGIPGAVLLSQTVRSQIKNHPEFQLASLGSFDFKNVEEPMEVFALANEGFPVPKPNEMTGKGKINTSSRQVRKSILWWMLVLVLLVAGAAFWLWTRQKDTILLPEKIRQERVGVIPFKNNTGQSDLDAFGSFTSDLITNGLTEAGIKTCSPRTILQYNHLIGLLPNNAEGKTSFAEATGAKYLVEGYFLKDKDSIIVKSYLTDAWTGEVIRNFPVVAGSVREKEKLSDQLCRRIMSYWMAREAIENGKFKPPLYEAYKEYIKSIEGYWWDRKHLRQAFKLDTTFYLPILEEMFWCADDGDPCADTIIRLLKPHYNKMTPFEKSIFDANAAWYERDFPRYREFCAAQFKLFPKDMTINSHYAFHLAAREKQPAKGWEITSAIDWENMSEYQKEFRNFNISFRIMYGIGAGHYDEAIALADKHLKDEHDFAAYYVSKMIAYIETGRVKKVYDLLEEIRRERKMWYFYGKYGYVNLCNHTAAELLAKGETAEANQFLKLALSELLEKPNSLLTKYDTLELAQTYRLLGDVKKAILLDTLIINQNTYKEFHARYIKAVGIDYALLGQKAKAEETVRLLLKSHRANNWGDEILYSIATIYAVMNEKEMVMDYLYQHKKEGGMCYDFTYIYKHDPFMKNLFGYQPFEEFVRIKE